MTPPVINGVVGAHQQPLRYGRNEQGAYTIQTFDCTSRASAEALIPSITLGGGSWEITEMFGGKCRMEARYAFNIRDQSGTPEVPENTWEMVGTIHEKDILESDCAAVQSFTATEINTIKNYLQTQDDADRPAFTGDQLQILLLLESGARSVQVAVPTLRHTQTVSNKYAVKKAYANVMTRYTTAQLTTEESVPADILFNVPTDSTVTRSSGLQLQYAFLKQPPHVTKIANRKYQIVQEWHYGLWAVTAYPAKT